MNNLALLVTRIFNSMHIAQLTMRLMNCVARHAYVYNQHYFVYIYFKLSIKTASTE